MTCIFDSLFENITAVTMEGDSPVIENACVGVKDGLISYIGTEKPEGAAAETINGENKVLMPGIVNSHTHLPMTLLRGYADDMNLQEWLFNHIFPAEAKLTEDMVYNGAMLAIMECLASGTVSVTDMYDHTMSIARAAAESGIMANLSRPLMCFDEKYDKSSDFRLRELSELYDTWHQYDSGRIQIDAAIHAEYTSPPEVWETAVEFARERGLGMHVHLSETKTEHDEGVARRGKTPAAALDEHGVFSIRTTAAHCVHITDGDMEILAKRGVTAVHNPVSNLKLDCGIARIAKMRETGVHIALGTDGVASNNSHDMFEEIKQAAILHHGDKPLTAYGALRLATVEGARAQGRNMGVIAKGKEASVIMLDFSKPHLAPVHNVISSLGYSARGSDVALTMIRGKTVYKNGCFPTIDSERVLSEARAAARIFRAP